MQSLERKWVLGASAIFFVACLVRAGWRLSQPYGGSPGIACNGSLFDFGTEPTGQVVEHMFYLRNNGPDFIDVRQVRPGCSCVETELVEKTIQPRASVPLKVKRRLQGLRGEVEKDIVVESNDQANRFMVLKIKGVAQSDFSVKPATVRFGKVNQREALNGKIDIQVSGAGDFHLQSIGCESPLVKVRQETLRRGRAYRVHVHIRGDLPKGLWETKVRIRTDNVKEPEIVVPVVARVEAKAPAVSSR
jgi:hypothetical protein